ncbi:MAG: hypothetical protein OSJ62_06455 [Lachnospiraceae bacterium]|nr:hypothetical protein [Lachnospiraceae bacterium]
MRLIQIEDTKKELEQQVKELYLEAFPKEERKPYELMKQKQREGKMQIWAVVQEDKLDFCGLAITILYRDIVLLDYFAICQDKRGKGIGSKILAKIKEKYAGKRLFLEIESVSERLEGLSKEERTIRERRKGFYSRNGMKETGLEVVLYGVSMEVLSAGGEIDFKEYLSLYVDTFGEKVAEKIKWDKKGES